MTGRKGIDDMKKIIAIALIVTCAFALFSCGSDGTIDNVNKMFKSVAPTKVVTETTEVFGEVTLTSKSTLLSGKVDGKAAATYEFSNMELRSIEDGSGDFEELPWVVISGLYEYHEDKGVRIDGGKWQDDMYNFAPTAGSNALNLKKKLVNNLEEDAVTKTVKFTVAADNTETVFGEKIKCDVLVTITHDGSAITSVVLNYTVPASDKDHPDIVTTVKVLYSYDAEKIVIK